MTIQSAFTRSISEITEDLDSDIQHGLTQVESEIRLERDGPNKLPDPPKKSALKMLINQFNDLLIYILIFAAMVTLVLSLVRSEGQYSLEYFFDSMVIIVVLLINAGLGFYQEWKAEKAVRSLQSMVSDYSTVLRDGKLNVISSTELVKGDVIEIQTGEKLSADIRIIESTNLKINESALTGESLSVAKQLEPLPKGTPLADRINMGYMGTFVEMGKGMGIVVATGIDTEIGKISKMVESVGSFQTPLQRKLEDFSSFLAKIIGALALFLVVFGVAIEWLFAGDVGSLEAILGLVIVGVSLAVAAIPEGLPIILTFALAISMQKLAKRDAIIRKLQAVETLGATTYIATDKTGTLTLNQLTLISMESHSGDEYHFNGEKELSEVQGKTLEVLNHVSHPLSKLNTNGHSSGFVDPLDRAIYDKVYQKQDIDIRYEFPFDSERKMMSVVVGGQLSIKGAPDIIIEKSTQLMHDDGSIVPMTTDLRKELHKKLEDLAAGGYRVIGVGYKELEEEVLSNIQLDDSNKLEQELTFTTLLTLIDPPRPEAFDAIENCRRAGIKVVMITGDHRNTAYTIAQNLQIVGDEPPEQVLLSGAELENLDDEELKQRINEVKVYARVTPEHKLRLVTLLKEQGEIVAMTGDGVNDSPALVKSDIGVAMGIAGTDAAKESADMLLMDDNFATLVHAVEEGRVVNTNIRKFTNYLLASNASEVLVLLLGFFAIAGMYPTLVRELIPLSETQILYLNLVTDSFLALALGLEVKERNLMKQKPRDPDLPIVTKNDAMRIIGIGLFVSIFNIVVFLMLLGPASGWINLDHKDVAYAQSFILTFLVVSETFIAVSYRSSEPVHRIGYFSNKFFLVSAFFIIAAQLIVLYVPIMNALFDTQPLLLQDWGIIILFSLAIFAVLEISKVIRKSKD